MDTYLIIIISLLFSALFSGMEIAFVSSNRLKIEVDKNKGNVAAKILSQFNRIPSRFISAVLLGNNISLVVYGIAMADILRPGIINILPPNLSSEWVVLVIQTIIATILVLIVAEFLPKVLFRINPNAMLNFFAIPAAVFYYLFYPVIYLYIIFSESILKRFLRIKFTRDNLVFSVVDLDNYVKEFTPENQGQDDIQQEIQMFQNAIDFRIMKLRECMIPRTEIVAVERNDTLEHLIATMVKSGHSKIPVYQDSIDNIIGYAHSADIFKKPDSIQSILRSIIVVPETMPAKEALSMFIQQNKSIAVVVDEFGGTSGIVTMEDIMEEIFGEIDDEFDVGELTEKQLSENEFLLSARLEIDYLNEKYQLNLPESDEYETLAGLIIHYHESIPSLNEKIIIKHLIFFIVEASETRIDTVRLLVTN
jgi:CBS domain containing-hemolysin-like protein